MSILLSWLRPTPYRPTGDAQRYPKWLNALGFAYVLFTVGLSVGIMYIMSTYLANDLFWPDFVVSGMQNAIIDFFNSRLALNATSLELLNPAFAPPTIYDNSAMTLSIYEAYPRLVLYAELTAMEKAVASLRELLATEVTHMMTQYCWVDVQQRWELGHSRKRQARCVANDKANAAVYLEAVGRNIDFGSWVPIYRGFFNNLIVSALVRSPGGYPWVQYMLAHAWVPIDDEVAFWKSHQLTYFELQWSTIRQTGLIETIGIENALGMTTRVTIKRITPVDRYALWTTHSMYASFENDLGNFYFGPNQSLVLNSPLWFGYTLPNAIEMYNLPYPLNHANTALHHQLGELGSVDLKLIPPPPALTAAAEAFMAQLTLQTAKSASLAAVVASIGAVILRPTPVQWQNPNFLFYGGSPVCADGEPYDFIQRSFGFDDTCAGQLPFTVQWASANSLFALAQLSTSDLAVATASLCSTLALPAADASICTTSFAASLSAFRQLQLASPSSALAASVAALNLSTMQFVRASPTANTSVMTQPLLDMTSPAWSLLGWMSLFEWALGQREAVAFEGDVQTLRLLSYKYTPATQLANTLDVSGSLANYMWGLAWYVSAGLCLVLFGVTLALALTQHHAGLNWFMFNRIASTVWVGRPILLVRSATAIVCLATVPIYLEPQDNIVSTRFVDATRPFLESTVLAGETLWLSYVLNEVLVHLSGPNTRRVTICTSAATFVIIALLDLASPPTLGSSIGRDCHYFHMDIGVLCSSGSIQIGYFSRVLTIVGIHGAMVLLGIGVAKLLREPAASQAHGFPTVLLHGAATTFFHDHGSLSGYYTIDNISAIMCGLLPFKWAGRFYIFELTLWRVLSDDTLGYRHTSEALLLPHSSAPAYLETKVVAAKATGTPGDANVVLVLDKRDAWTRFVKKYLRVGFLVGGFLYILSSLFSNIAYMTVTVKQSLANDFYWPNFNSSGGHTFLANLFNTQLLLSKARNLSLNAPFLGDVRQFYNTSVTTIRFPETIGRRQLYAPDNSLVDAVRDLRSMQPCKAPWMFTQYCWLDLEKQWPIASSSLRQARCASQASNGAVYLETVLRNLQSYDEWRRCWGDSYDMAFARTLQQSDSGKEWLRSVYGPQLSLVDEVARWKASGIRHYTLQWQSFKTLGIRDAFTIRSALSLEYELTLADIEGKTHIEQQTSLKMYWTFASDLWAVSTNASSIGGKSLIRGSANYAFANTSSEALLMHNLTLTSPLPSGFASLRSIVGPFGNADMHYVPVPASLLQWYQAMQDALTTLLVMNPIAQAAFLAIPQKQYIGQFPRAFAQSGIAFEGGNVLCGNDQASAPINFWIIVASPIFRAFSTSNACYRLVFEFFEPDEFLLLFALSGFGASHRLGYDTLDAICHYDYSPGDNCGGIYNSSVAFLRAYNASTLSAFAPLARVAERDVKALDVQFLQYLKNATFPSNTYKYLFRINILDDSDDISWVYFGWCFMYAWASGLREVVSFQGDHGTLTAISGPLSTITMQANPAEVRQDLANVLSLSVQYITMVFLILASFTALYAINSRGRIEGLNLFEMNRTFGLVWVGRPFLMIRSLSAMIILHTNVLNISQMGAFTVFTSPTILWYNLVLASGELNWLIYVLNDSFSFISQEFTSTYALLSSLSTWFIMIVWTAIEPCEHVAYTDRRCSAIDMDFGLHCHSAFVEVGFVNRIGISVLICVLAIISCFLLEKYVLKSGLSMDVPSLLLSAPAKYMLILDDWSHKGVLFVDKPSALMAGIISIEYAGGIFLFDIKKWRMYVLHRAPRDSETPSRFLHAIPMLE